MTPNQTTPSFPHFPRLMKWLCTATFCIVTSLMIVPQPVRAQTLFQGGDPPEQCAEGIRLFNQDQNLEAFPLLEFGYLNRSKGMFPSNTAVGDCAMAYGTLLFDQQDYQSAIDAFSVALRIYEDNDDKQWEIFALEPIAMSYQNMKLYDQAIATYQQELDLAYEIKDKERQTVILRNIALLFEKQGDLNNALKYQQLSLALNKELGNREDEVSTLFDMGTIYAQRGLFPDALEHYEQALMGAREIGDRRMEAIVLASMGSIYSGLGDSKNALLCLQESLPVLQALKDRANEGITLYSIGNIYLDQGMPMVAMDYFKQALSIAREMKDRETEATVLNGIGLALKIQGLNAEAIEYYQQALIIQRAQNNRLAQGTILSNIADIYADQNRSADALAYYQEALELQRSTYDTGGVSVTLNDIGVVYGEQGQYEEALKYFEESLKISIELGDRNGEADTLGNMGRIYSQQGDVPKAMSYYEQQLQIYHETGNRYAEQYALNYLAGAYESQQLYQRSLDLYLEAQIIARESSDHPSEFQVTANLANLYVKMGWQGEALASYRESLDLLELLRSNAGSDAGRTNFTEIHPRLYDNTIMLYSFAGRVDEAFFTSERGRARAFLDSLSTGDVQLTDQPSIDLLTQEQEYYSALLETQAALSTARAQYVVDNQVIRDLEIQLQKAESDYKVIQEKIDLHYDQLGLLTSRPESILTVEQVQSLIDQNTTLVAYWITIDGKSYAFIITREEFRFVHLDVTREDLTIWIDDLRSFSNLNISQSESSKALYQALVQPLEPYLLTQELIIIPHSTLNYLPFAALSDGEHFLLDTYNISYLPSASTIPYIQQNALHNAGQSSLILGNPDTSNYDEQTPLPDYLNVGGSLPFAENEAETIASLLGVRPHTSMDATESLVKNLAPETRFLHLAAHGLFDPVFPLNSLIALAPDSGNDGLLTVSEVYGLDLRNTELVVLSACDTQLGQLTYGDELVGLTRAFFFAGTPTVVASLWEVDDQSTAMLMAAFYRHMTEGMSKSEALKMAQIDIRQEYPNPYYWAGFVLSGDPGVVSPAEIQETAEKPTPSKTPGSMVPMNCGGGLFLVALIVLSTAGKEFRKV